MKRLTDKSTTTDPIAIKANIAHNFVIQRGIETVKAAIACGKLLCYQKDRVGHGKWQNWVKVNLDFSLETANVYMRLYINRDKIEEIKPLSLRAALHLVRGDKRVSPGKFAGDKKILFNAIVRPVKTVKANLRRLPVDPVYYDMIDEILAKLREVVDELADDLKGDDS